MKGQVVSVVGRVGARHTARALGGGPGKDRPQAYRDTETSEAFSLRGPITGRVTQFQGVFSVCVHKGWRLASDTLSTCNHSAWKR